MSRFLFLLIPALLYHATQSFGQEEVSFDSIKTYRLNDIVVTASRLEEDFNRSPVSVEKLNAKTIAQSPAPSFFDALENIKGVHLIVPSLGFKVINTRGFANTTNVRFVQMVDGMDNQAPHLGAPIANMLGPSDLDINSVEILSGTASALYGMNAINGLANFLTKDPFVINGVSAQQKLGINRINEIGGSKVFSETSLRWAHLLSTRFAFKFNATFTRGTDWTAHNRVDLNKNANRSTGLFGMDNPAYDPVNSYGNESSNRRTLSLGDKNYVVARTGYYEKDVVDYGIQNIKGDAALHYAFSEKSKLIYTYRYANLDNIYQRSNRFRLENYQLQQHGLAFKNNSVQLSAYLNMENTGESYNARSMAENLDRATKSDDQWFSQYTDAFNTAIQSGLAVADAHHSARMVSDNGRPVPGSNEFSDWMDKLGSINNWDYGAALRVRSQMLHAEGQISLSSSVLQDFANKNKLEILSGFDHRTYIIVPDGNYFINPQESGKNLTYSKSGMFVQTTKAIREKLKVGVTLRADKNEYYKLKWNPRATIVYSLSQANHFRTSVQNGFRFPSIFEAFSNVNSGGVKRVGGLPVMSNGIFENAYKRASIDGFQAAVVEDINQRGLSRTEAILKNQSLLVRNDYSYVKPEEIRSIEVGYRGFFFGEDLQVDVDLYFNRYKNFIAQVEMNIPKTPDEDSIAFYLNDRRKQDRYRMWTNSKTIAYNFGAGLGFKWNAVAGYQLHGNLSYAKLQRTSANDGLEDGFNTPNWIANVSGTNTNVYNNYGFSVSYRWQSSFYWQSFLVNGGVPSFQTVDLQLTKNLKTLSIKVGATNIFNHYYYSFLGGPAVGGFYYTAITYNPK